MIYVTSDLHGYDLSKFQHLLEKAGFFKHADSYLFLLGDVIDRQNDGGVAVLKWLLEQPNAELIRGNHEQMLLDNAWLFEKITEESLELVENGMDAVSNWLANGAEPTIAALKKLMQTSLETIEDILQYLRESPLYETVSVGDRDFVLTHAALGNFDPNKKLSSYTQEELLWYRPHVREQFFEDATLIFGHTPTEYYGSKGSAFRTKTWIDIDTSDTTPTVLCLDTMLEFRLED